MLLTSPTYFIFLSLLFFAWWPAVRHRRAALGLIVFANLLFYAKWNLWYLFLVPAASTADFLTGLALGRAHNLWKRRCLVTASILLNTCLILSMRWTGPAEFWPLTLSFYAFQSLTYTIDVYRRDQVPSTSYLAYLCSSTFFPTTLAGPITRVGALLKQFENRTVRLDPAVGGRALFLIGLGLMKKFLIADYLAEHLVTRIFDTPRLYSSLEVALGVYAYAFQLFYDFSGYTDIARGSAMLLGLQLPENFKRPYAAGNLALFWRRWHITLSDWLRDYLYFSLPGLRSRHKMFAYLNLVITMAIGGLWHGLSFNFLIWGLLHGFGLAAVRFWQTRRGPRAGGAWLTFHFVAFTWIFFRSATWNDAVDILHQIIQFTYSRANIEAGFLVVLGIAVLAHFTPDRWYAFTARAFTASPSYVQAGVLAALVIAIQYVGATGAAPFIYTKF